MAKKSKNHLKNEDPNVSKPNESSKPSSVFNTLFGETTEQNSASNSIFSENNPFRRKLLAKRPNGELGLTVAEKDGERWVNLGVSDLSETQLQRKRKKEKAKKEISTLDTELVEEKSKKPRRHGLKGNELTETLEKDGDFGEKKKKKRKRDEVEAEYEARRYGPAEEMNEAKGGNSVLGEKRKKMDNPEDTMVAKEGFDDESKLLRTVFVGNLSLKLKKKEIVKEFEKFGEVESVRFRSVPIADGKIPRKGAVIKKQINENCDSVHAYVVFKTEESAQASLAHNMAVVEGNHIRVDRACPPRKKLKGDNDSALYDNKRTVFVGNLPFDVKDEEIYKLFCGIKNFETSVEGVRVIRDPGTSLGKGIAYVLFKTTDAANLIAKKRNLRLRDRELRLSKSTDPSLKRKSPSQPETYNKNSSYSANKKLAFSPRTPDSGNKFNGTPNSSYQGLRASKSGAQKKVLSKAVFPAKSKSQPAAEQHKSPGSGKKKRPSVAARKEKALKAAAKGYSQAAGTKRKMGNRTPVSGGQKKKARKLN